MTDQQAIERYRYMLRTAPPEAIEQAHEEAFVKLTPEQRRTVLEQLAAEAPRAESGNLNEDPRSLARAATRAEIRQPGFIERMIGSIRGPGFGGGFGLGGVFGGTLLASLAGTVIGSAVAQHFFDHDEHAREVLGEDTIHETGDEGSTGEVNSEPGDDFDSDSDFDSGGDLV